MVREPSSAPTTTIKGFSPTERVVIEEERGGKQKTSLPSMISKTFTSFSVPTNTYFPSVTKEDGMLCICTDINGVPLLT